MRGIVKEEIDEDGWEYSNSFGNFSVANVRRTYNNLDVVRRRRWVRQLGRSIALCRPFLLHSMLNVACERCDVALSYTCVG